MAVSYFFKSSYFLSLIWQTFCCQISDFLFRNLEYTLFCEKISNFTISRCLNPNSNKDPTKLDTYSPTSFASALSQEKLKLFHLSQTNSRVQSCLWKKKILICKKNKTNTCNTPRPPMSEHKKKFQPIRSSRLATIGNISINFYYIDKIWSFKLIEFYLSLSFQV